MDLLLDFYRLKHYFLSAVDIGQAQKVFAFDMGQPYDFTVLIILLLFLIGGVIVELKLGSEAKAEEELHEIMMLLDYDHTSP